MKKSTVDHEVIKQANGQVVLIYEKSVVAVGHKCSGCNFGVFRRSTPISTIYPSIFKE